ncbi:DUF6758 family protein [Micromonospora zhanjiangensis]|uniref:DUF6758 family protein n=1 Tax=Micromonospora zhanjiangensis TaxID=1522057 RepID=A0ABV8KF90_9ACTN
MSVSVEVTCPRCGGSVRAPDLMHAQWRCEQCGPVPPLHVAGHVGPEIVESVAARIAAVDRPPVPLWCPWPLPPGWTMTGVARAGDDRSGVRATAVACSGPAPLGGGPADLVLVAEEPGVGLGTRFAGIPGPDPGDLLSDAMSEAPSGHAEHAPHAKVRAGGHPTPLWSVKSPTDRSAYVGEARGMWLYAITWPASAGYLLAEDVVLHDLTEWLPPELVYGAPSPYLHGMA